MAQQRFSFYGLGVLSLVALLVLVACSTPTAAPAPEAKDAPAAKDMPKDKDDGKPKYGGIMVEAESLNLDQVNPDAHISRGSPSISVEGNIHGYLLAEDMNNRGEIIGDLVTEWSVSDDGMTYTFKLRDNVKTHKGKSFGAADAAYSINRMITRPNNINMFRSGCMNSLAKEAKAIDNTTLTITVQDRTPTFIACVSNPYMFMIPKYTIEPVDAEGGRMMLGEEIDGVGPFEFVRFAPGSYWEIKRSDNFYKDGLPYMDGIKFVQLPDPTSKIAAFRTQRIDMFQKYAVVPAPSEAIRLKAEYGDAITFAPNPAPAGPPFQLNWKRAPLDDIRVREAIDLAYNRQIENEIFKEGQATWSGPYYCGWGTIFTCEELLTWPGHRPDKTEDIARAKELLIDAGYGPGNPLPTLVTVCGTADEDNCTLLFDSMKKIGVDLKLVRLETSVRTERSRKGDFDITVAGRITPADDPEIYNGSFYLPDAPINFAKWENPKFMELYHIERQEMDPEKRVEILREMSKIIYNDHVSLHSYNNVLTPGFWNYVKGYTPPIPTKPHQTTYRHDETWIDLDSPFIRRNRSGDKLGKR